MDLSNLIVEMTEFNNSTNTQSNIDEEYYKIEDDYRKAFGHGVPREMLPSSIKSDDIKKAMKECIKTGRDDLFPLLNVEVNPDYLY